ncbi:MAG: sulfur carrier protein ThiS [Phycisphaerales bacterium]
MEITLNGQTTQIADRLTVRQLIEQLGLAAAICAVEINGQVVPRGEHEQTSLAEGDSVEIVTLVGGG